MPTILRIEGYSIKVPVNDHRPAHIHVFKAGAKFKVDLEFLKASEIEGTITKAEIRKGCRLVLENAFVLWLWAIAVCVARIRKEWEKIHGEI